ncbi:hypothetical protein PSTG_15206 [Puccinia striiformis f. sp. tritici PST-78]|uniref:CCHC-type domain-containing protein n=2 Tax=Puccinia striiformis f. sp. tritici PST-78 TaxID=1165861 RepID=A0A0L0UWG5_9BASI|nr:hypothetical protein PSTG_15206 [Puccinia striiformis f. sp. tritici PST-78]
MLPTAPSDPNLNLPAAGGSNWDLGDASARNRLAEDIATLQANLTALPLSPEVTGGNSHKKSKQPASRHPPEGLATPKADPPHMTPRAPAEPAPQSHRQQEQPAPRLAPTPEEIAAVKLAKEMRDFEAAEFYLKQQKLVNSAIQFGKSLICPTGVLQPDGSNFGKWFANLEEIGRMVMANQKFFFFVCSNSTYKKIGRAVILASIHESLVAEISAIPTCFLIAAQMNIWYKFRSFKIDPNGHNAGIASALRDLHSEWIAINVVFTINSFLGFVLQASVADSGAPYQEAFGLRALDICKEQHRNTIAASAAESSFTSPVPPSALATTVKDNLFDPSAFLTSIDPSKWVDALDFYAIPANKCWQCGGNNHYARNCPDKLRAGTGGKAMGQPLGTIVGTIYGKLPSGLPISSERYPRMVYRKSLTPPSRNQEHARGLADYYQPRYPSSSRQPLSVAPQASAKGGVSAQIVDIGDVPDDLDTLEFYNMGLGEDLVSDVAVFDTGASHGFTGSKSLLHDFRSLSKLIGVSVTTTGAGSFITGMGSLKFQAPNGHIIVLRPVLYCEQAKTTLISMAALWKANALVAYDNNSDTF